MSFDGFSAAGLEVLRGLVNDNSRDYFQAHKADYDEGLIAPAKEFVVELAERLQEVSPGIIAEPRINGSIFRINRDVRFSKDKSPYKTNLALYLWEGTSKKVATGYYLSIEPEEVMLGVGSMVLNDLDAWRAAVDDERGEELVALMKQARKKLRRMGEVELPAPELKRVPKPYPADHPRGELLRMKRYHAMIRAPHPSTLGSKRFLDWCEKRLVPLAPLHAWLFANTMPPRR